MFSNLCTPARGGAFCTAKTPKHITASNHRRVTLFQSDLDGLSGSIRSTILLFIIAILGGFLPNQALASMEYAVQVSADVQTSPAQIRLSWPQIPANSIPQGYTIYRKTPGATSWGTGTALPGTATSYLDQSVSVGNAYEYQVVKHAGGYTSYGYIYAGIQAPLVDARGRVILVVDNTFASPLAAELARLEQDLVGDGWNVSRIDVARTATPVQVKGLIKTAYQADSANTKAVFLFGHVPVPYSGNIVPDGHSPEHYGAWPADMYYGDLDGNWTDSSVNNSGAKDPANRNVPGDGKFDQSHAPSAIELQVGRVDLANMPGKHTWNGPATFPSELELLRNYLNKDHKFRHKQLTAPRRAIVGDYFGARNGEAFAASGWRNFAPMVGSQNITHLPNKGTWIPALQKDAHLLAYGCGAGSYSTIGGLGNHGPYLDGWSTDIVETDSKAIFTLLFGSWLGDWDSDDNIMRSILATKTYGLTCGWSGRPHWYIHHMALGETIGYGARLTQNNPNGGLYRNQVNSAAGQIHIALMGDPTLRLHPVAPAASVNAVSQGSAVAVSWNASAESVEGYHVYRASSRKGPYVRLTQTPVKVTTYQDSNAPSGSPVYMVRAVKLESSASGTYFNASQGSFSDGQGSGGGGGGSTPSVVTVHATDATASEAGSSPGVFTISRTGGTLSEALTVQYAVSGSAAPGTDYTSIGGSVVIPAGAEVVTRSVVPVDDSLDESDESVVLTLAVGSGYSVGSPASATITIADNDSSGDGGGFLDSTAPVISMLKPSTNTTVSGGAVLVSANATDNVGVSGVQFMVDGQKIGVEDTVAPFEMNWDCRAISNGSHVLTAEARDAAGNKAVCPGVQVMVSNSSVSNDIIWVDDALPAGAIPGADGGDGWNWIASNPAPHSGGKAHQSSLSAGSHQHFFDWATSRLQINAGEVLFAYVYLDPSSLPSEIMLQWNDGSWDHRAYWGANQLNYGTNGTPGRHFMGALPESGKWVRLEVPAKLVALEGKSVKGMAFTLFGGRATWDRAGKSSVATPPPPPADTTKPSITITAPSAGAVVKGSAVNIAANASDDVGVAGVQFMVGGSPIAAEDALEPFSAIWDSTKLTNGTYSITAIARDAVGNKATSTAVSVTVSNTTSVVETVWCGDKTPEGAVLKGDGGDSWNWITSNPTPFAGTHAHQSNTASGLHQHYFDNATKTLTVGAKEILFAHVYLDPIATPTEVMLQWNDGTWEHRAYWGANQVSYGQSGTASRYYMGPLPAAGKWVRLEVPAHLVGLEGKTLKGMAFTLFGGKATWDRAGKATGSKLGTSVPPVDISPVSLSISPAALSVKEGEQVIAKVLRTGDLTKTIGVVYTVSGTASAGSDYQTLSGSLMMPAGATSVDLAILTIDDTQIESDEILKVTLSPGSGGSYQLLPGDSFQLSIIDNDGATTPPPPPPPPTSGPITGVTRIDYMDLQMPQIGDHKLSLISPDTLELALINTKAPDPGRVTTWDLVDTSYQFRMPSLNEFKVAVNGVPVTVSSVGFKRRPFYAPLIKRDLRIYNALYLKLDRAVGDGQKVQVTNPTGTLWSSNVDFTCQADPLRFSPVIHVNQEGYTPNFPKQAMVGYFLGTMGELALSTSTFQLVNAATGSRVFEGTLKARPDIGYVYTPTPYQKVYEADFTTFNTPGIYRILIPGCGASLPFRIDDGVLMSFVRTYAMGLYHQRCGHANEMPYTRHTHAACHKAPAEIPSPQSAYAFTWNTIAAANADYANNPRHTAPRMISEATQLYPFVNKGTVDVSGGHHDAGDYSKYTINSAGLLHYLIFAVDNFAGVANLDNLGLPESGDGISDLMQEARIEAQYLSKLQDADGGFYFIVYPKTRKYEQNVTPDRGDTQVVWPKNTASTAVAVAALAQTASSPVFKKAYPAEAAKYLQQAKLGWDFLARAIAKYGKDGSYQKITFYGDIFMHDDELAWAACEMFLATGDPAYQARLMEWFDPANPGTRRWGWWRLWEAYGRATRSYAFAARNGRLPSSTMDAAYLAKCEAELIAGAQDHTSRAFDNAYGTSFPNETKRVKGAGWYFGSERAFDIAVAYQLNKNADFVEAILSNMNYEGGCNPVNASYLTGIGTKRQREIVHQYAQNDRRVMPPSGIPIGNIQAAFAYLDAYKSELGQLTFPQDGAATSPYPYYDRWADSFNVSTEFVHLDQGRAVGSLGLLASQTQAFRQPWKSGALQITGAGSSGRVGTAVKLGVQSASGMDLTGARILWEGRDHEPTWGGTFNFTPKNAGTQWVEVEVQWPDGRRAFGEISFDAN